MRYIAIFLAGFLLTAPAIAQPASDQTAELDTNVELWKLQFDYTQVITSFEMQGMLEGPAPEGRETSKFYLSSLARGLRIANIYNKTKLNQKEIFCIPEKLNITSEQVKDIFIRFMHSTKDQYNDAPPEVTLIFSYVETFPCDPQ